jgi:hypothetical protein
VGFSNSACSITAAAPLQPVIGSRPGHFIVA